MLGRLREAIAVLRGRGAAGLRAHSARPQAAQLERRVRGRDRVETTHDLLATYDSARTTDDNTRHWRWADTLSAAAANSPDVRRTLRARSRYECQENNSYGKGMAVTLANDVIGTGPRLEVLLEDEAANRRIETAWRRWSRAVRLAAKLRTLRMAKFVDGEGFAILTTNPRLPTAVQLDLRPVEADQVASPSQAWISDPRAIDGLDLDEAGNVVAYHVLREHPGGQLLVAPQDSTRVPADQVIHLFRCDRPGQYRGIPEPTPALPLFAQLRRFTLATLDAAEGAARIPFWLYTDAPPNQESADIQPLETIDLERNMATAMPAGWKVGQMEAKHPATTYEMFKREILREIGRVVLMPYNLTAGDSSNYNYASGRLDHQTYFRALDVERADLEIDCLDRLLSAWFDEAVLVGGVLPEGLGSFDELPHRWAWDQHPHVDPAKEAAAVAQLWQLGLLTDDDYLHGRGVDPDEHYQRLAAQYRRRKTIGAPLPTAPASGSSAGEEGDRAEDEAEDQDGDRRKKTAEEGATA